MECRVFLYFLANMSVVFQRMAPYFGWRSLSQANFVNDLVLSSLRNRNTHSLFLCLEGSSAGSYLSLERAVSLDFQFRTYFTARWVYLINTWSINSAGRASQWEILTITWILLVHRVNFNLCTAPRPKTALSHLHPLEDVLVAWRVIFHCITSRSSGCIYL